MPSMRCICGLHRERLSTVAYKLLAPFVQADEQTFRIKRTCVDVKKDLFSCLVVGWWSAVLPGFLAFVV